MRIALVDDHLLLSESIKIALEKFIPNAQINVFNSSTSFLDFDFGQWQPDLVITDILMPTINGLDMLVKAKPLLNESCRFIVMSSVTDSYLIRNALKKGVHAYVAKGGPLTELMTAIQDVQEGKQYISQALRDDLLHYMLNDDKLGDASLSPRENEVLQQICAGRTPKEIAFDMNLSLHTVQLYIKGILRKFKLHRTTDVVAYAIQKGLYRSMKF